MLYLVVGLVGAVLLVGGAALLVVAGVRQSRRWQRMVTSGGPADPDVSAVAARAASAPVEGWVSGRAAPGPDGILTSPMTGTPCVWYYGRASVREPYLGGVAGGVTTLHHTLYFRPYQEFETQTPFLLEDGRTRMLVEAAGLSPDFIYHLRMSYRMIEETLDPSVTLPRSVRWVPENKAEVHGLGQVVRALEWEDRGTLYEEWVMPPGRVVHVHGLARTTGDGVVLGVPPSGDHTLSLRPPNVRDVVADARRSVHRFVPGMVLAILGLLLVIMAASVGSAS